MKKKVIHFLSLLMPRTFTKLAYDQLTNPQVHKLREHEVATLNKAESTEINFKSFKIKTYHWKGNGEKILLIHGWEGQAGNFSDLIEKLIIEGYDIHAFDAASHGLSSRGKTSLFDFTDLTSERIKSIQPKKLISHSFGGVATTYSLQKHPEFKIEKYVLITTPDKLSDRINDISNRVGISQKVRNQLISKVEIEAEQNIESLNVSEFVKQISVEKALILHDVNDKIIPFSQSENVNNNWEASSLIEIRNTGHFRILRTDSVLSKILAFIK